MKVCFFSRCNLVYLYGALDKALSSKYKMIHVAYSATEYKVLNKDFNIPDERIVHFKKELKKYLDKDYSAFDYEELDSRIINATEGRFNLNLSIQVDRGLHYKKYEDSEKLIAALYEFWSDYFDKEKPNIIFHEMVSLSINHLCAVAAKERNILYTHEIQVHGLFDSNFILANYWGGKIKKINLINNELKDAVEKFIFDFKNKKQTVLCGGQFKNKSSIHYLYPAIKNSLLILRNKNRYPYMEDYIENFFANDISIINKYKNLKHYSKIKWDDFDSSKKYYYYPFHLEPEAAVYYMGDGIYSNQVKLIENIAASLPANTYLYVKDHPHDIGYRDTNDYLKLKQINNIKLIHAKESGYEILKYSQGIITINGSAGFEALLLDKPVYYFGNPYYESFNNTFKIRNIRDLQKQLLAKVDIKSNFNNFIEFFSNTYRGNISLFYSMNYHDEGNLKNIIESFDSFFTSLGKDGC